jgi:molybdenum cofactor synthesis domain-containing protein
MNTDGYPKRSVDECMRIIEQQIPGNMGFELIDCDSGLGRVVSADILSRVNVPTKPTSILDGFAVKSGSGSRRFTITRYIRAGDAVDGSQGFSDTDAVYVSTGAVIPNGLDCVVPIEVCQVENEALKVSYEGAFNPWTNIREIGSDTRLSSPILKKDTRIGPGEMAVLKACQIERIPVYRKFKMSILSTGAEIASGQVGDANKSYMKSRITKFPDFNRSIELKDLGVIEDDENAFSTILRESDYNVLVSTGSVSKGKTDLMGASLERCGFEIVIGRVDMKPGKPTTIAFHPTTQRMVFALPGNPASCFVAFNLFVLPALLKLQGVSDFNLNKTLVTLSSPSTLQPDSERPEYLRARAYVTPTGHLEAELVEGHQRSSRVASCSGHVNCLVRIEPGKSPIFVPERRFEAILLPGVPVGVRDSEIPDTRGASITESAKAKAFDSLVEWLKVKNDVENIDLMNLAGFCRNCLSKWLHVGSCGVASLDQAKQYIYGMDYDEWKRLFRKGDKREHAPRVIPEPKSNPCASSIMPSATTRLTPRCFLLTVSDRAHSGIYPDLSGPLMESMVIGGKLTSGVSERRIVPDELDLIRSTVKEWMSNSEPTLILISGGTGFSPRDVTPEAVRPLITKEATGLLHLLLSNFVSKDPIYGLSRPIIGSNQKTLIVTLPGNPEAVKDGLTCLLPVLPKVLLDLDR